MDNVAKTGQGDVEHNVKRQERHPLMALSTAPKTNWPNGLRG